MDGLSNWIDNLLNLGDPEVRTWFLIRQKSLPLIITAFYIVFSTIIGPAFMKNRKSFELRNVMIVFNFSLVIVYASFIVYMVWTVRNFTFHQFCHGTRVKKGDVTYRLASACWIIYIVKYVEYFDTVFFILRKKQNQVTFLHVIHHALVPFCIWIVSRTETSGMVVVPGFINAMVHVIMYLYYGLAAFGPEVRKYLWWKKHLTQLQMVQFLVIITFALVVAPLSGCKMVITSYIIQFTLAPLFLYLFYSYYRRSFIFKRTPTEVNRKRRNVISNEEQQDKETHMIPKTNYITVPKENKKLH